MIASEMRMKAKNPQGDELRSLALRRVRRLGLSSAAAEERSSFSLSFGLSSSFSLSSSFFLNRYELEESPSPGRSVVWRTPCLPKFSVKPFLPTLRLVPVLLIFNLTPGKMVIVHRNRIGM